MKKTIDDQLSSSQESEEISSEMGKFENSSYNLGYFVCISSNLNEEVPQTSSNVETVTILDKKCLNVKWTSAITVVIRQLVHR